MHCVMWAIGMIPTVQKNVKETVISGYCPIPEKISNNNNVKLELSQAGTCIIILMDIMQS